MAKDAVSVLRHDGRAEIGPVNEDLRGAGNWRSAIMDWFRDLSTSKKLAIAFGVLEILTIGLDGEIFAVEAACVREILDLPSITEVPGSRPFVRGLINVRGKVCSSCLRTNSSGIFT